MIIWTIQPLIIYEQLKQTKILYTENENIEVLNDKDLKSCFLPAYEWLIKKMEEKIPKPNKEIQFPWWGWHTRDFKYKKPDLRETGYHTKGMKLVCLTLEIPNSEVLLSDFDNWHYVLNNWYLGDALNEEDSDLENFWFNHLDKFEQEKIKLKSWNKIFNIEPIDGDWYKQGQYIQATFWDLKLSYVKDVQYFIAK